MRIGIDARPLIEKKTGIGYYLNYLLENILKYDTENEYILFSDRKIHFNAEKHKNLILIEDLDNKFKKTVWYIFCVDKLCKKHNIDIFWGTQHVLPLGLKNIKKILTVHDLVAFDFKETMSTYNKFINKLLIPRSIKVADKIICVSRSTEERLKYHFAKYCNNKSSVIHEDVVVNTDYYDIRENYLADLKLNNKEYLIFVGTIEPRKNIETLIEAFKKIHDKTNMKLVICGKYGWKCEKVKATISENSDKIIFLNYVTDIEKNYLMKESFAFVFPSLYEGFGLPVLEAMRNNTIAIVANNTSLKEIIEYDDLKFDTLNFNELSEKIIRLYENKDLYDKALEYCNEREKYFNWDQISKQYVYELTR